MIKIYVANLAKYNEGILKGEWIDLPSQDLESELAAILGNDEEYAIHDYEAPFKVSEYANIFKLNELAEQIDQLSEHEQEHIEYILETGEKDIQEALETVENGEYNIYTECYTMKDVAMEYVDQIGSLKDAVSNIDSYLDFEAFKRDLEIEGYFSEMEEENGEEYSEDEKEAMAAELLEESADETKEMYFDFEAFGRDMEIEGSFYYVGSGVYVELHN